MPNSENLSPAFIQTIIKKLMVEESGSEIQPVMLAGCRLGVLIPVYDERIDMLLRPLLSLARQQQVSPEEFEVIVLVNNSLAEARQGTTAFLHNQLVLRFLSAITSGLKSDQAFSAEQHQAIKILQQSGMIIHALDKSSPHTAEPDYQISRARNRGCLELAARFLSVNIGLEGVIAMVDADCRVSENFVRAIIDIYQQHDFLNGLSGTNLHEIDGNLPNNDLVRKIFLAHSVSSPRPSPSDYPDRLVLQKRHRVKKNLLLCGANMTMRARSWLEAGAFPDRSSGEDFLFGFALGDLPGDVGLTDRYQVFQLLRPSTRTGFSCYGRRVAAITQAVADFKAGRQSRLLVPNFQAGFKFINFVLAAAESGSLTGPHVLYLMSQFGCNPSGLNAGALAALVDGIIGQVRRPQQQRDFARIDNLIVQYLYQRLPLRDVTYLAV